MESVRIRVSMLDGNTKYAYRSNQGVQINNDLWRYNQIMCNTRDTVLNKFTETELVAIKLAINGYMFKDGKVNIERFLDGFLADRVKNLTYIEKCALLNILEW